LTGRELSSGELSAKATAIELVHKLATVFYQLGKAYVLAATDSGFRQRVFENALPIEPTQTQGRGFVDGVLLSGKDAQTNQSAAGVDWQHARHMLNGRLQQIQSPLEKGRRLLEEAIAADPSHEEARLYMAFLLAQEGKKLKAAEQFQDVFETALSDANRGHAAVQLGQMYVAEGDHRRALRYFRWVTMSGLEGRERRFFVVLFNIGVLYALRGDQRRSLDYFRRLIDRHPERTPEVVDLFAGSRRLQQAIDARPGFAEALVARCPELFGSAPADAGAADSGSNFGPSGYGTSTGEDSLS
jgi:tetratricopeptide (TPR) repeat protein